MLLTPYAEVFGYRLSRQFLAISLGAHVVYGLALWAAARYWGAPEGVAGRPGRRPQIFWWTSIAACAGLAGIAADFHARHTRSIPASPPGYIGPHLLVTWDVLEPDRVAAMWVYRRFVDPKAQFHLIGPFSRSVRGTPFDTPEAAIRRTGAQSATEVLLAKHQLEKDPKLQLLGRMTHLYEITPWLIPSERAAQELGQNIRELANENAAEEPKERAEKIMAWLDRWYEAR
jgi:hypothetical protein